MILITPPVILPFSYKVASAYEGECQRKGIMKDIIAKAFGISMLILMVLSLVSFALWGYWL
jgi:hypothetical protein